MSFPAVFIVGPTATGKSRLAHELALKTGGCILNADSIQLYQGLSIGSAAPTDAEKGEVDHFLFQVVPKGKTWTASEYQEKAWEIVERELKSRLVVIVGGSGFYVQALERGMGESKSESEEVRLQLEAELIEKGAESLHEELRKVDPEAAERVHTNDHYRLLRALGYYRTYGTRFSEDQKLSSVRSWPGKVIKVGLSGTQEELRAVIEKRTQSMMERGFVEEVKHLLDEGLEDWWPLQSVGYKEVAQFLKGEIPERDLIPTIVQKTLYLAKRQKTWFKRDDQVQWYPFHKNDQALTGILSKLS